GGDDQSRGHPMLQMGSWGGGAPPSVTMQPASKGGGTFPASNGGAIASKLPEASHTTVPPSASNDPSKDEASKKDASPMTSASATGASDRPTSWGMGAPAGSPSSIGMPPSGIGMPPSSTPASNGGGGTPASGVHP